ncbi:MAG: hypothetical protein ACLQF1_11180 [Methyloceanibacter sp.]|jgi:hypothetical protein
MASFDPLDLEILERALDGARAAIRGADAPIENDTDPETLRDLVLVRLSDN